MTELIRSAPMVAQQVGFQAETERSWTAPTIDASQMIPLRWQAINRGRTPITLFLLDTLRVVLSTADGRELALDGGRNATRPGSPAAGPLASGADTQVNRDARLVRQADGRFRLIGPDGFGGIWYIDGLTRGEYKLGFRYHVTPETLPSTRTGLWWTGRVETYRIPITLR